MTSCPCGMQYCRRSCWCCRPNWLGWTTLLDDPVLFARFVSHFDARLGRRWVPVEICLRMMSLKFRYWLSYESLCREVGDSISWQRF
ncbi:hypothetical protein MHPYR_440020 [uncultured Mycobacterium sp.]|uniref:Transposase InsH N-terminal domain-containing protein n=1 Tax=uncultured Mycobacterium sp. TaxID=171292 RepID=A0A1Y5PNQ0_9MYCO|nr:hypothetical protein MHPYR_440020 [uncultured Mycobacterium sp.]